MHKFLDSKGRPWEIEIHCDSIEQIKVSCDVNVLDLADPESDLLKEINAFPPLMAKLLFAAVSDQAKLKEVDEKEFRRSMNGDALSDATDALLEEIILFCPKHRRSVLQAVLESNREVEAARSEVAVSHLRDPKLMQQVRQNLDDQAKSQIASALANLGTAAASESSSSTSATPPPDSSESTDLAPALSAR